MRSPRSTGWRSQRVIRNTHPLPTPTAELSQFAFSAKSDDEVLSMLVADELPPAVFVEFLNRKYATSPARARATGSE